MIVLAVIAGLGLVFFLIDLYCKVDNLYSLYEHLYNNIDYLKSCLSELERQAHQHEHVAGIEDDVTYRGP